MTRILGLAEQPWGSIAMQRILKELIDKGVASAGRFGITDNFCFLYNKDALQVMRASSNFEISTLEDIYWGWQLPDADSLRVRQAADFTEKWIQSVRPQRSKTVLERTNRDLFADERDFFHLATGDEWKSIIFADTLRWCTELFNDFEPEFVIALERSTLAINICYELAMSRGIEFQTIIQSRIGSRWVIRDDFGLGTSNALVERAVALLADGDLESRAVALIEKTIAQRNGSYASLEADVTRELLLGKDKYFTTLLADILRLSKSIYNRILLQRNGLAFKPIRLEQNFFKLSVWQIKGLIHRHLHILGLRLWGSTKSPPGRHFAWALHARPEGSVKVLGGGIDEIEALLNVATLLPTGVLLVVKENPEMFGYRNRGFYRRLNRHPNICLVDFTCPSADLIDSAIGVLGISGTFLLEAAFQGKPVMPLGRPEFDAFLSHQNSDSLSNFIRDCLNDIPLDNDLSIIAYVCWVLANSSDADVPWLSDTTSPDFQLMISRIATQIEQRLMQLKG